MKQSLESTSEAQVINTLKPHQWVEHYADYLYTYALARLNDEEQAKDIVQETFLSALEKMDTFRGASTERTWLTAILKHKVIDVYRKKIRTRTSKLDSVEEFFNKENGHWNDQHYPQLLGVEDQDPLSNKELAVALQRCMKKLPALWLSVFTMKHMDDELTETICKELSVSSSNFWVIIHRSKVSLRACLQKSWL